VGVTPHVTLATPHPPSRLAAPRFDRMLRSPRPLTTRRVVAYGRAFLPASRRRRIARRAGRAAFSTGVAAVAGVIADCATSWHVPDAYGVDRDVRETLLSSALQYAVYYYLL